MELATIRKKNETPLTISYKVHSNFIQKSLLSSRIDFSLRIVFWDLCPPVQRFYYFCVVHTEDGSVVTDETEELTTDFVKLLRHCAQSSW